MILVPVSISDSELESVSSASGGAVPVDIDRLHNTKLGYVFFTVVAEAALTIYTH